MLSTKDMSAGSGKIKPVVGPGNHTVKINEISYMVTPYDPDSHNIILHVETSPVKGEFQGFLKDVNNQNGPRYEGQVGRVRFSPYAFKDTTLPNGKEISKVDEVMKSMIQLSETLGKREALDQIEASTIEDFMTQASSALSGEVYINICLASREWVNKEGYVNNDLYLPKPSSEGVAMESIDVENSNIIKFDGNNPNHLRKAQVDNKPADSFEPAKTESGSDFEF